MTRPNGMHTAIAVATAIAHRRARSPVRRVAMLSMHTSPLAPLGGRETGGMNVYVHAVSAALARAGLRVDVFARRTAPFSPEVQSVTDGVRLIHVPAGPAARVEKEEMDGFADEFASGVSAFADANGVRYDFVHS
ncbi:MAG: glycosyltransferase, partial [Chloroflexi bacterium]|nr:glycosyltransferase [Chloroflexota bacterium]